MNLKWYCQATVPQIFSLLDSKGKEYAFQNNSSKILAVAHCDVVERVVKQKHFAIAQLTHDTLIYSTALDDRLGVFTILEVLPALGIKVDVLLTKGEEIGKSTAEAFVTSKNYNWIVEFDRKGTDAVVYKYGSWRSTIGDYFKGGYGSFSDICELEHLGCCGVNVGVGYHDEHTSYCCMSVPEYREQLCRFVTFYHAEKDVHYPHTKYVAPASTYNSWGKNSWAKGRRWRSGYWDGVTKKWVKPGWEDEDDDDGEEEMLEDKRNITCPSCGAKLSDGDCVMLYNCSCCPMCGTVLEGVNNECAMTRYGYIC